MNSGVTVANKTSENLAFLYFILEWGKHNFKSQSMLSEERNHEGLILMTGVSILYRVARKSLFRKMTWVK